MWTRGNTIGLAVTGGIVAAVVVAMGVIIGLTPSVTTQWPGKITRVTWVETDTSGTAYGVPSAVEDPKALAGVTSELERAGWTPGWRQGPTSCAYSGTKYTLTFDKGDPADFVVYDDCGRSDRLNSGLQAYLRIAPTVPLPLSTVATVRALRIDATGKTVWSDRFTATEDPDQVTALQEVLEDWTMEPQPSVNLFAEPHCAQQADIVTTTLRLTFDDGTTTTVLVTGACAATPDDGTFAGAVNALVTEWATAEP